MPPSSSTLSDKTRLTGLVLFLEKKIKLFFIYLFSSVCLCYRKLGLDLIPRIEERIVEPDSIGVYELYNVVSIASPIVASTNQRSLKSRPRADGNF